MCQKKQSAELRGRNRRHTPHLICYGVLMLLLNCKQSQDEASLLLHFLPTARPTAIFKIRAIPEDLYSSHTKISLNNVGAIQRIYLATNGSCSGPGKCVRSGTTASTAPPATT